MIRVSCECGWSAKVKDDLAGRKVRCKECEEVVRVPEPASDDEDEAGSDPSSDDGPPSRRSARDDGLATRPRRDEPPPRPRRRERDDSPLEPRRRERDEPNPFRKQTSGPRKKMYRRDRDSGGGGFAVSGKIIAGLLMMVGAIVWFILGIAFGWVYCYPPFLFVIGLVTFVRGLMGHSDD